MLSDIILFGTLLLNAGAVINFKLPTSRDEGFIEKMEMTAGRKICNLLGTIRYFRALIGLWNILVMFLMLVFFSS
ncbi:protein SMIM7 homolog isoform X2 [Dermacentor variabilis]|uniref:protein SMIM7 homolog isoform X2 n=1 Tax=Dermacentor variabilis TaxID=34621 RepID=UPI003F5B89B0